MCRITGVFDINYNGQYDLENIGNTMRDTMIIGGPDSAGEFTDKDQGIYLGHRRLSIIDLSNLGHQPMQFLHYEIIFNGEVFNYKDIQKELIELGYTFVSNSDTEVVLKAYIQWGMACVEKFHGFWAFAIWNKEDKKLIICRDRMGVKPMYLYQKDGLLMFSSELKAFHQHPQFDKKIDQESLSLFLQQGYIAAPKSIFKYCRKLEPASYIEINNKLETKTTKYWDIQDSFQKEDLTGSEEELTDCLEAEMKKAFSLRMVSDVPVGVFLSGGVDSSTVAALIQSESSNKINTFTIGFEEAQFNEATYAKEVAAHIGTNHHEYYCTTKDAQDIIPKFPELYDEPFGDSSGIPTFLVSKFAAQHVKVSLSADGGDEQMMGYNRYKMYPGIISGKYGKLGSLAKGISPIVDKTIGGGASGMNTLSRVRKLAEIKKAKDQYQGYVRFTNEFFNDELKRIGLKSSVHQDDFVTVNSKNLSLEDFMMLYDQKAYMIDDILCKVDRATMGNSLEGREPMLDHKLMEFTAQLPTNLKYRKGIDKYLLRKVLYKYVPQEMIERPKMGFGIPLKHWFQTDLKDFYLQYMNEDYLSKEGTFNAKVVSKMSNLFMENKLNQYDYKMWFLFVYLQWKDYWKID